MDERQQAVLVLFAKWKKTFSDLSRKQQGNWRTAVRLTNAVYADPNNIEKAPQKAVASGMIAAIGRFDEETRGVSLPVGVFVMGLEEVLCKQYGIAMTEAPTRAVSEQKISLSGLRHLGAV